MSVKRELGKLGREGEAVTVEGKLRNPALVLGREGWFYFEVRWPHHGCVT